MPVVAWAPEKLQIQVRLFRGRISAKQMSIGLLDPGFAIGTLGEEVDNDKIPDAIIRVRRTMGVFAVEIQVRKPGARAKFHVVGGIMVDPGWELTWVFATALREAGISVRNKNQPFVMANGDTVVRDLGYAIIRYGGFETVDEVVFA